MSLMPNGWTVSEIAYKDLSVGQIVNMHVWGDDMRFSITTPDAHHKFTGAEIVNILRTDAANAVVIRPQYSSQHVILSNIDFRKEYRAALESMNLSKIENMQQLIAKAALEKDHDLKPMTQQLAKDLGFGEHASDQRLQGALSDVAYEISNAYLVDLWSNGSPQFMMTYRDYSTILNTMYDLTHAKLQQMQEQTIGQTEIQTEQQFSLAQALEKASSDNWLDSINSTDYEEIDRR
jgi:hypothetical protein